MNEIKRYLTEPEKGGVVLPDDIDEKTGDTLREVLVSKHPELRAPDISTLEEHDTVPDFLELEFTADAVEKVARQLGGSGASDPQHWVLRARPAQNFEKQWQNSCGGKLMTIHLGQRTVLSKQDETC